MDNGNFRHGGTFLHKLEYNSWRAMKSRCLSPSSDKYRLYGGRGISICDRWLGRTGFNNFLEDMGKRPSKGHSLDRIDTDGDYSPDNCRWATQTMQVNNSSVVVMETVNGITDNRTNHIASSGMSVGLIYKRMKDGMTFAEAITTPNDGLEKDRKRRAAIAEESKRISIAASSDCLVCGVRCSKPERRCCSTRCSNIARGKSFNKDKGEI